jgi:hypothetical protein
MNRGDMRAGLMVVLELWTKINGTFSLESNMEMSSISGYIKRFLKQHNFEKGERYSLKILNNAISDPIEYNSLRGSENPFFHKMELSSSVEDNSSFTPRS